MNGSTSAGVPSRDWRSALRPDEIAQLLEPNDLRGWAAIATNWAIIFGAMALVAVWPHPLAVVAALFLIGTRQLGLAVLMHDASHRALFRSRRLNDLVGRWLAAYPVWLDLDEYRPYHLRHHTRTWTKEDPDLHLARPFPVTAASFRRKVWRDLSGRTGLKFVRFAARRDFAGSSWRERLSSAARSSRFRGMLATNATLVGLLAAAGHPALYFLWVGAYLTTNTLVTRIRSIAEHSMVPDPTHPLLNTRTTLARWWERLLIAPNHVNYHLEHHLLMTVPPYRLPRLHRLLRERGALDGALVERGYLGVLRRAASRAA